MGEGETGCVLFFCADFTHTQSQQSSSLAATDGHFRNQSCNPAPQHSACKQAQTKMRLIKLGESKNSRHKFCKADGAWVQSRSTVWLLKHLPEWAPSSFRRWLSTPNKHPTLCTSISLSPTAHSSAQTPTPLLSHTLHCHSLHRWIFFLLLPFTVSLCLCFMCSLSLDFALKPSKLFTVGLPPLYVSNLTAASFNSPVWRLHDKADMGF